MKYGFLTTLIPPEYEEKVRKFSSNNMQDAANALQWNLINGLYQNLNEEIKLFNVLPIGSFPQYYKKPFIRTKKFAETSSDDNTNIGFCNVKLVRKLHQPKKIYSQLRRWCESSDDSKTLFVYTISAPFLSAVSRLKNDFPDLKVCAIVADLPDMSDLSAKKSLAKRLFARSQATSAYSHLDCIDYFVLLTAQMAEYMKIKVPFCVVEGISTSNDKFVNNSTDIQDGIKRIMYSGTLHRRFGILNLVEAFRMIDNQNCKLIICGIGDSQAEIEEAAKEDGRIEFHGQLPREKVLSLQSYADVLVNPRQNTEEFTKYSFPSKTLEYLSSGKPLVAYKLDGIPDEYDKYINYVENNSSKALKDILEKVCFTDADMMLEKAERARDFVINEKNCIAQTLKIKELIKEI